MVLLNPEKEFIDRIHNTSLTFHYGAIKPQNGARKEESSIQLTFHYGAIKP